MMRLRPAWLLGASIAAVAILSLGLPSLSATSPPKCNSDNTKIVAVPEQLQVSGTVATVPDIVVQTNTTNLNLMPSSNAENEYLAIARGSPGTTEFALTIDINAIYDGNSLTLASMRSSGWNDPAPSYMSTMARESGGGDLTVDDDTGNHSGASGASTRASPVFDSQTDANNLPSSG